jgi:hypothetical protein
VPPLIEFPQSDVRVENIGLVALSGCRDSEIVRIRSDAVAAALANRLGRHAVVEAAAFGREIIFASMKVIIIIVVVVFFVVLVNTIVIVDELW